MDDYRETNRSLWNGWTDLHAKSPWYDLAGFKTGASTLKPLELRELGDVRAKSLLHLQCHFGMDTLSWARLGARVTGVDFSERSIELARSLGEELRIDATFIRCDVMDLPRRLTQQFDIVFTSYGALPWLPDVERWARLAASYVRPGGVFYMVEFHPIVHALDDDGLTLKHRYFHSTEPARFEERGSYADRDADFTHAAYEWSHTLGDVVSALIDAGLRLEFLHEFPYSSYDCFPFTEQVAPGRSVVSGYPGGVPLMYSIRAGKPITA